MTQELINQIKTTVGLDLVAIYNSVGIQVFKGARIRKISATPEAELPNQPVETGVETTDHIIFKPKELEVQAVLSPDTYLSTYKNIEQAYNNAELFTVQTKVARFERMAIASMPHEEDAKFFNTIVITLHFKQVIEVVPVFEDYVPEKKSNTSATQRGSVPDEKPATPTETKKASSAYQLFGKK